MYLFTSVDVDVFGNSWCNNSWMDWPVVANLKGFLGYLVNFYQIFSPFKIVNSYGVFPPTSAPPLRWVVVLEGKAHNGKWKKYHCVYGFTWWSIGK